MKTDLKVKIYKALIHQILMNAVKQKWKTNVRWEH